MNKKNLTLIDFEKSLLKSIKNVNNIILNHEGVLNTMKKKLQFEKWYQIELYKELLINLNEYDIQIQLEYELKSKLSKRGLTIDLALICNDIEKIGLELKIIPTNYNIDGFDNKAKRITNIIADFVYDIEKTIDFEYSYSLAMIFPFPLDKSHRNYSDFEKQEFRMKNTSNIEVSILDEISIENFINRYYLLKKNNKS